MPPGLTNVPWGCGITSDSDTTMKKVCFERQPQGRQNGVGKESEEEEEEQSMQGNSECKPPEAEQTRVFQELKEN